MQITLRLKQSIDSIPELSRAIDAFEAVDEVYRLMKSREALRPGDKVDFRRKPLRDTQGGDLEGFKVSSPPEIIVNADNLWIAALPFILKDYSNVKDNIHEASQDSIFLLKLITSIRQQQYQEAAIGARLLADRIAEIREENMKWLSKKLEAAQRILREDNIESLEVEEE